MAQAVGDPEEQRIIADKLQRYLEILDEETNHLTATFEQLGDTWNDCKRDEFAMIYEEFNHALDTLMESASDQIPHLRTMADDLETYLGR